MNQNSTARLAYFELRLRRFKRALKFAILAGIVGWGATLMAQEAGSAPEDIHVFKAGDPALASEVNDNFRWLVERIQVLEAQQVNTPPTGTIVAFAGESAPLGWLLCDGRVIAENDYPELAGMLGTAWDTEGASLRLPDLRGRFLRGLDDGAGRDADSERVLGSYQSFAIENIKGKMERIVGDTEVASGVFESSRFGGAKALTDIGSSSSDGVYGYDFDASRVVSTASETRPANAAVNFIIKY